MKKLFAVLEDCIMMKGGATTCGSKILEGFNAPFDAVVATRLKDAGVEISGKVNMKEFGLPALLEGASHEGELSGAVRALLDGKADYCLCNDLFGRYRREAAETGLHYIQPTYGTVPRYGLVPLAPSMDQIGVLCKNAEDGFKILEIIAGSDPKDGAMFPEEKYAYTGSRDAGQLIIRVPENAVGLADFETRKALLDFPAAFARKINRDSLDYFDIYKQVMFILTCAEISNNLSRYDGVKFGYRSAEAPDSESLYTNTRTEALGLDVKLISIIGAMVLSGENYLPYYEKAMKIRRLIKKSVTFEGYDIIALPASCGNNPYDNYMPYALGALAGLPSVVCTFKCKGILLLADVKKEAVLLQALNEVKRCEV